MRTLCLVLATALAAVAQETLTVATFNCEFLVRRHVHVKFGLPLRLDGAPAAVRERWRDPAFRDRKFREATGHVARVLAALRADVLALTEVGDERDVAELQERLRRLGAAYPHRAVGVTRDTFTGQNVAVLSRFPLGPVVSPLPGTEGYDAELDDPETEREARLTKALRTTFRAAGRTFHLFVAHLTSERGGHAADAERIAQASLLRRHLLPLLQEDRLVILAGDLNDGRGQPALRRVRGRDDVFPDLLQTGRARYFPREALDTRWTYAYQGVRRQLDHILLSPAVRATCLTRGIRSRVPAQTDRLASDHRPFVVTLRLRPLP